jgi:hypothetical protein
MMAPPFAALATTITVFTVSKMGRNHVKMRDLILNDVLRCNDYKCPTAAFCARSRQLSIDYKKGVKNMPETDFKGFKERGLCDYFLNADILATEQHEP